MNKIIILFVLISCSNNIKLSLEIGMSYEELNKTHNNLKLVSVEGSLNSNTKTCSLISNNYEYLLYFEDDILKGIKEVHCR